MRVSLSEGLYLNFNAKTPPPSSSIEGTGSRIDAFIHVFIYGWAHGPIRFDFTTLEFAGNKFSTEPSPFFFFFFLLLLSSSELLLVGPSRSIGNITSQNLKLNHFTALVPTLVPRFHVFRSFLFSNLESKVAFFEIYNLKIFDRKRENIESKRIRRIILELESIVEQFQFRGGILKISNYSFYTDGRDGFFATPCNNFQQFEEDRFLFPLLRIDSLLILTLFPLFDPVIFLQNRTVNPIPRPFLLVLTSIKPFLVYTLGQ